MTITVGPPGTGPYDPVGLGILGFGGLLLLGLLVLTTILAASGGLRWNEQVSRRAKAYWGGCYGAAWLLVIVLGGPALALSIWDFWLLVPLAAFGAFGLLDFATFRAPWRTPRQERVITHADGTQARVDARTGAGYQRMETTARARKTSYTRRALRELGKRL